MTLKTNISENPDESGHIGEKVHDYHSGSPACFCKTGPFSVCFCDGQKQQYSKSKKAGKPEVSPDAERSQAL
jgi:hypothetical protein